MKTELEEAAKKYANKKGDIPTTKLEDAIFKQGFIDGALWQQKQTYSKQQTFELMKKAFEAGFKKADVVEAGLEPKETEQEVTWILTKFKNK